MSANFFLDDPLELEEGFAFKPIQPPGRKLNRVFFKGGGGVEETADEKEQARVNIEMWDRYDNFWSKFEDQYMDNVDAQNTDAAYDFAEGTATQNSMAEFSKYKGELDKSLSASGINPNSGRAKETTAEFRTKQGVSTGDTSARADTSQQDEFVTGLNNIVAIGQGQATDAQSGIGSLATSSANKAKSDAYNAFNDSAMKQQAVGQAVGLAGYSLKDSVTSSVGGDQIAGRQGDVDFSLGEMYA